MIKESLFTGVCTALVTPFHTNGSIAYETLAELIERQLDAGVNALCICGTTGEASTMSIREHLSLIEFTVKQVNLRTPVIAGVGSNDTAKATYLSQHAQELGADGLLHVTPYYNKASQDGLIQHFSYIADRVDLPIILYNVPQRTGLSFTANTYAQLSQHPNIHGVKEASGDLSLVAHTRRICGNDFHIWSGNDDQTVPLMSMGARGVVSVVSNVIPEAMGQLAQLCLAGNFPAATQLQAEYLPFMDAMFVDVNPIPIKAALKLHGLDVGPLRLPLCQLNDANFALVKQTMEEIGLSVAE